MTVKDMQEFLDGLHVLPADAKQSVVAMTPATYISNARRQAKQLQEHLQSLHSHCTSYIQ